ncbi:hypothetical protein BC835DRAFT_1310809 [Cytidiella melzeri]|nr:hypothetical protein BC835DRAFT_1310809 [Cytidiella melzeri]
MQGQQHQAHVKKRQGKSAEEMENLPGNQHQSPGSSREDTFRPVFYIFRQPVPDPPRKAGTGAPPFPIPSPYSGLEESPPRETPPFFRPLKSLFRKRPEAPPSEARPADAKPDDPPPAYPGTHPPPGDSKTSTQKA